MFEYNCWRKCPGVIQVSMKFSGEGKTVYQFTNESLTINILHAEDNKNCDWPRLMKTNIKRALKDRCIITAENNQLLTMNPYDSYKGRLGYRRWFINIHELRLYITQQINFKNAVRHAVTDTTMVKLIKDVTKGEIKGTLSTTAELYMDTTQFQPPRINCHVVNKCGILSPIELESYFSSTLPWSHVVYICLGCADNGWSAGLPPKNKIAIWACGVCDYSFGKLIKLIKKQLKKSMDITNGKRLTCRFVNTVQFIKYHGQHFEQSINQIRVELECFMLQRFPASAPLMQVKDFENAECQFCRSLTERSHRKAHMIKWHSDEDIYVVNNAGKYSALKKFIMRSSHASNQYIKQELLALKDDFIFFIDSTLGINIIEVPPTRQVQIMEMLRDSTNIMTVQEEISMEIIDTPSKKKGTMVLTSVQKILCEKLQNSNTVDEQYRDLYSRLIAGISLRKEEKRIRCKNYVKTQGKQRRQLRGGIIDLTLGTVDFGFLCNPKKLINLRNEGRLLLDVLLDAKKVPRLYKLPLRIEIDCAGAKLITIIDFECRKRNACPDRMSEWVTYNNDNGLLVLSIQGDGANDTGNSMRQIFSFSVSIKNKGKYAMKDLEQVPFALADLPEHSSNTDVKIFLTECSNNVEELRAAINNGNFAHFGITKLATCIAVDGKMYPTLVGVLGSGSNNPVGDVYAYSKSTSPLSMTDGRCKNVNHFLQKVVINKQMMESVAISRDGIFEYSFMNTDAMNDLRNSLKVKREAKTRAINKKISGLLRKARLDYNKSVQNGSVGNFRRHTKGRGNKKRKVPGTGRNKKRKANSHRVNPSISSTMSHEQIPMALYRNEIWATEALELHVNETMFKTLETEMGKLAKLSGHGCSKAQGYFNSKMPAGFDPVHYKPKLIKRIIRHYFLISKNLDAIWHQHTTASGTLGPYAIFFLNNCEKIHTELKSEMDWYRKNSAKISRANTNGESSNSDQENRIHATVAQAILQDIYCLHTAFINAITDGKPRATNVNQVMDLLPQQIKKALAAGIIMLALMRNHVMYLQRRYLPPSANVMGYEEKLKARNERIEEDIERLELVNFLLTLMTSFIMFEFIFPYTHNGFCISHGRMKAFYEQWGISSGEASTCQSMEHLFVLIRNLCIFRRKRSERDFDNPKLKELSTMEQRLFLFYFLAYFGPIYLNIGNDLSTKKLETLSEGCFYILNIGNINTMKCLCGKGSHRSCQICKKYCFDELDHLVELCKHTVELYKGESNGALNITFSKWKLERDATLHEMDF